MNPSNVAQHFPKAKGGRRTRLLIAALMVPFVIGIFAAPAVAPRPVNGDELADAQAQQAALAKRIKQQKALVASITASQNQLSDQIDQTKTQLNGITQNLAATRHELWDLLHDWATGLARRARSVAG